MFKKAWMRKGKVGELVKNNHMSKADVVGALQIMQGSIGWSILELALEDFKGRCEQKLNRVPIDSPAYDRIIAVTLLEHNFKSWIENFVNELKAFEDSADDGESDFNYL